MRHPIFLLAVVVSLGATACSSGASSTSAAPPISTTVAATPASTATAVATATAVSTVAAAPTAVPHAKKPGRKAPKNYKALQAELAKKCPIKPANNNMEEKQAFSESVDCLHTRMIKDLDAVLVPLKKSDPTKFAALMKEQANWNAGIERACYLEEERMWVDFDTGRRDDGTYRSYTLLGCYSQAYTERTMYARSLAAGKIKPLVKHIEEMQAKGEAVKDTVADILQKSIVFQAKPPAQDSGFSPDWNEIIDEAGQLQAAAKTMAKSTCESWPDLAKALGGKDKCLTKAENYYYVQGNNPTVGGEEG